MNNQTPPLISEQQFNEQVKGWTTSVRRKIVASAPVGVGHNSANRQTKKLAQSITYGLRFEFGSVSRIRFSFERHGVFVQYGVGRGYIRSGGAVVRGFVTKRKGNKPEKTTTSSEGINRHPVDWYDSNITEGLPELANYTQEYYGDMAMQSILSKLDKFLIQKKT